MVDSQHLAGILASRICHDLVSPVGAVVNGMDLIREVGAGDAREELAMVGESAKRASALLQFFRIVRADHQCSATVCSSVAVERLEHHHAQILIFLLVSPAMLENKNQSRGSSKISAHQLHHAQKVIKRRYGQMRS